jgi:DNA-binding NarL/FixJ family response regulator
MSVKIVLVDDQPVPGLTLRRWLKKQRELEVVGEAVPGSPVLALIQITEPDVVLLDVLTSPEAGLNMARLIHDQYPDLPIVAIGEPASGSLRAEAAEAGAWAYFPKGRPEELTTAIRSVIEGGGRSFVDLTNRTFTRPPADSFVALPDQTIQSRAPRPPVVAAPAPPPPPAPSLPPAPPPAPSLPPAPPPAPRLVAAPPPAPPRPPAPVVVAGPQRPTKPAAAALDGNGKQKARRSVTSKSTAEVKRVTAPGRASRDAVAWVSSSLQPVVDGPPQRVPRKRRKKKDETLEEIAFRGPTGLPRRSGGHR